MNQPSNLTGGWSDAKITDELKKAAEYAVGELNPSAKLQAILLAKMQVVSGINYELHITLDNGETWEVVVYRSLKNDYQLTRSAKLQV